MNVLLLHLPRARRSFLSQFGIDEPLAHAYLASALRGRHDLRFVDLRLTPGLAHELGGFRPAAVVVGVNPLTIATADGVLGDLRTRYPGVKIVLVAEIEYGFSHVEERPRDFLHPLADVLVQPYYQKQVQRIVSALLEAWAEGRSPQGIAGLWLRGPDGSWLSPEPVDRAEDVHSVGVPDRAILGKYRGRYRFGGISRMAQVFYTFGCRFKCRFCPMSKSDGSMFARPVAEVVDELASLEEPHVYLQDFEPFLAPLAMDELASAVERAGIRKSWYMLTRADTALAQKDRIARWQRLGLRWLYLGLDGESPQRLKEIRKSSTLETNERALREMRALGLCVFVGFVVRSDYTRGDFAALRAYVKRLPAPLVGFTVETPLVGTRLFDETESLLTSRDWSLHDLCHAVLPTAMPLVDFYRELTRLRFSLGLRALPAMLRHYPVRDSARVFAAGPRTLLDSLRAARDHETPPMGGRQPTLARLPGAAWADA